MMVFICSILIFAASIPDQSVSDLEIPQALVTTLEANADKMNSCSVSWDESWKYENEIEALNLQNAFEHRRSNELQRKDGNHWYFATSAYFESKHQKPRKA